MLNFLRNLPEREKSLLLSAAVHAAMTVIFLLIRAGMNLPVDFTEIGFVSAAPARSSTFQPAEIRREAPERQSTHPSATVEPQKNQTLKSEPKPPVQMPKRAPSEEKPQLRENKQAEKSSQPTTRPAQPTSPADASEKASSDAPPAQTAEGSASAQNENELNGQGTDSRLPYTIEGDAAQRRIIAQYIPSYPPGLQREAVVKIRFWVAPDGRISQMIPVIKGDPKLEAITMDALRKWRFSALAAEEEQKTIQGIITFIYKLR